MSSAASTKRGGEQAAPERDFPAPGGFQVPAVTRRRCSTAFAATIISTIARRCAPRVAARSFEWREDGRVRARPGVSLSTNYSARATTGASSAINAARRSGSAATTTSARAFC